MILLLLSSCLLRLRSPDKVYCFAYDRDEWSEDTSEVLDASISIYGEDAGDLVGLSIAPLDDIDGDNKQELLIGAPGANNSSGKIYLRFGSSFGNTIGLGTASYSLSDSDIMITGENAGDQAGYRIFSTGDIDGDALPDILIGAPGNDEAGNNAGKIYLFLGKSIQGQAALRLANADYSFLGEEAGNQIGMVMSAGDVDGDGKADILIGVEEYGESRQGKAYLILGSSLGETSTINLSSADYSFQDDVLFSRFGASLSNTQDVDGDGKADILIGASDNQEQGTEGGKAYLIFASTLIDGTIVNEEGKVDVAQADSQLYGYDGHTNFGHFVSMVEDLNGDGSAELLIGGYDEYNYGQVHVFSRSDVLIDQVITLSSDAQYYSGVSAQFFRFSSEDYGLVMRENYDVKMVFTGEDVSLSPFGPEFSLDYYSEGDDMSLVDLNGDGYPEILIGSSEAENENLDATGRILVYTSCRSPLD